jgi:Right handed beta helix region
MTRSIFIAAALALAAVLPAIPAQATSLTRTFVSSAGSDSNPCTITQPCATFARAYSLTLANGIIAALDPGKYGPVTITGPVTVNGYGWAAITGPASGNAITINANSTDKIALIGLEIDGANAASNGIQFKAGSTLSVRNSVIQNFTNDGIDFEPSSSSSLLVSNTVISDNGNHGILISDAGSGTTTGVLNHVEMENNRFDGLIAQSDQTVNITVSDSVSANNGAIGILANPIGTMPNNILVRNSTIANNGAAGLQASNPGATLRVTRSTITDNGSGWVGNNGGIVLSYGDNNIDGNLDVNTEPPNPLVYR